MAIIVKDLLRLVQAIVPDLRDPAVLATKMPLVDAAVMATWRILTSRHSQHNWFVVSSQNTTPGQPDFFPQLTINQREYPLPPNFHQLRSVEVLTPGLEHTIFKKANIDYDEYRWDRTAGEFAGVVIQYDILGTNPGTFQLAKFLQQPMDVRLWYVKTAPVITAATDSLDDFPRIVLPSMAQYLAKAYTLGAHDERFGAYVSQWSEEVERLVFGEHRDNTQRETAMGFLEEWWY
jgi:hypothetical protein